MRMHCPKLQRDARHALENGIVDLARQASAFLERAGELCLEGAQPRPASRPRLLRRNARRGMPLVVLMDAATSDRCGDVLSHELDEAAIGRIQSVARTHAGDEDGVRLIAAR